MKIIIVIIVLGIIMIVVIKVVITAIAKILLVAMVAVVSPMQTGFQGCNSGQNTLAKHKESLPGGLHAHEETCK